MTVQRIVANLPAPDPAAAAGFWKAVFGLDLLMDAGFIVTLGTGAPAPTQVSLAREGGSGTPLPTVSIEVDDLDACLARARAEGAPAPRARPSNTDLSPNPGGCAVSTCATLRAIW